MKGILTILKRLPNFSVLLFFGGGRHENRSTPLLSKGARKFLSLTVFWGFFAFAPFFSSAQTNNGVNGNTPQGTQRNVPGAAQNGTVFPDGQPNEEEIEAASKAGWFFSLGGGMVYQAEYEGADESETSVFPLISLGYDAEKELYGFSYNVFNAEIYYQLAESVKFTGTYAFRSSGEIQKEKGAPTVEVLNSIGFGLEFSLFLFSLKVAQVNDNVEFHYERDDRGKFTGTGPADEQFETEKKPQGKSEYEFGIFLPFVEGLPISLFYQKHQMDQNYAENNFSVEYPTEDLEAYDAEAGFYKNVWGLGGFYSFMGNYSLIFGFQKESLIGEAADSPLTEQKDSQSVNLFLSYRF